MESRGSGAAGEAITGLSGLWWLWLVTGIAWIVVSVVILREIEPKRSTTSPDPQRPRNEAIPRLSSSHTR